MEFKREIIKHLHDRLRDGFHRARSIQPKFPEILVQNRMEQKISGKSFRKFRFTSRGCPFFCKFGNSGNFLSHLHFYLVWICPSSFSREKLHKMAASLSSRHYTAWVQNNVPQFEPVFDCLFSTLGSDFLEKCGLVVPNFVKFSSPCLHTSRAYWLSREKSSQVSLIERKWCLSR